MAKFHGEVGFATQLEISPGVWDDFITERPYNGDVLQKARRWPEADKVNNDLELENRFSIIADVYAYNNLPHIRYIKYLGVRWTVSRAEINRPRLILSIGSVYNGPTP